MLVNTSDREVSYLSGYGLAGTASALAAAVNVTVAPPSPVRLCPPVCRAHPLVQATEPGVDDKGSVSVSVPE